MKRRERSDFTRTRMHVRATVGAQRRPEHRAAVPCSESEEGLGATDRTTCARRYLRESVETGPDRVAAAEGAMFLQAGKWETG